MKSNDLTSQAYLGGVGGGGGGEGGLGIVWTLTFSRGFFFVCSESTILLDFRECMLIGRFENS